MQEEGERPIALPNKVAAPKGVAFAATATTSTATATATSRRGPIGGREGSLKERLLESEVSALYKQHRTAPRAPSAPPRRLPTSSEHTPPHNTSTTSTSSAALTITSTRQLPRDRPIPSVDTPGPQAGRRESATGEKKRSSTSRDPADTFGLIGGTDLPGVSYVSSIFYLLEPFLLFLIHVRRPFKVASEEKFK